MSFISEKLSLPSGLQYLEKGYSAYATSVVLDRALPAIDGFKPSQRRILYTMYKNKMTDHVKSANMCGMVLKYHPHGDATVYDTATRLVDKSEHVAFPFISGKGNFGKVYSTDMAAAPRYTECWLHPNHKHLFGEMGGVPYVQIEGGGDVEPSLLPVSFPYLLTSNVSGIAVGVACNMPSFNFNDVINATIEYIKTGAVSKPLVPDFTTGGEYVYDEAELRSIMQTGQGKLKVRGTWFVDGRSIVIKQIPYNTNVQAILKVARGIKGVTSANDETDISGLGIRITCSNKSAVDTVMLALLKDTGLQSTMSVNYGVIVNNEPQFVGVEGVLQYWLDFRREVLNKQLKINEEALLDKLRAPRAIIQLVENTEARDRFLDAMKVSAQEAKRVLIECLPDADADVIDYILDLKMREFADCDGRRRQLRKLEDNLAYTQECLADIDRVILEQLSELDSVIKIPRKTEITTMDYSFESLEAERAAVEMAVEYPVTVIIDDLFIKKVRRSSYNSDLEGIKCLSSDIISLTDSQGRFLRVTLDDVPVSDSSAVGTYIPTLLDIPDDFTLMCADVIADTSIAYMYSDGYASVVDYSEWVGLQRLTKITKQGMSDKVGLLIGEINLEAPYMLVVTKEGRLGIFSTEFKHKHRTARTKLGDVPVGDEIVAYVPCTEFDLLHVISGDISRYTNKCNKLAKSTYFNEEYYQKMCKRESIYDVLGGETEAEVDETSAENSDE